MEIEFTDGEIYEYFQVPAATFERLISSTSTGADFNREVRGNFACKRLT